MSLCLTFVELKNQLDKIKAHSIFLFDQQNHENATHNDFLSHSKVRRSSTPTSQNHSNFSKFRSRSYSKRCYNCNKLSHLARSCHSLNQGEGANEFPTHQSSEMSQNSDQTSYFSSSSISLPKFMIISFSELEF